MVDQSGKQVRLILYSFGFKHGIPVDATMILDVRFLPNPYWQEELRPMSGRDAQVAAYVIDSEQGNTYLSLLKPFLLYIVQTVTAQDQQAVRLAIGCTGGRHRSVAIVEELRRFIMEQQMEIVVFHRDLDRETDSV